jgi:hypothetical protein
MVEWARWIPTGSNAVGQFKAADGNDRLSVYVMCQYMWPDSLDGMQPFEIYVCPCVNEMAHYNSLMPAQMMPWHVPGL